MSKLILITGGSGSGKSTLSQIIAKRLGDKVIIISQDAYYKPFGKPTLNYDKLVAIDFKLLISDLQKLIVGQEINKPIYDFTLHDRVGSEKIQPNEYIIMDGIFAFNNKEIMKMADFKIFVDTRSDTRLARRLTRDIDERNRTPHSVIRQWQKHVQPGYKKYIGPMREYADIIVPWKNPTSAAQKAIVDAIIHMKKK